MHPTIISTVLIVPLLLAPALAVGAGRVEAQVPPDWNPARLHVTRAELEDLLGRYEAVAESNGYSSGAREDARQAAARIRTRLERGDFRPGDQVLLTVERQPDIPDTLIVEAGPAVVLPDMGRISLEAVLRSELEAHLTKEIGRYIRDPIVHAAAPIRLQLEGAVPSPGFHTFPSDMLLTQVLGGSIPRDAKLDEIQLKRADETLAEDEEVEMALRDGWSLDQLNLQSGDRIIVPIDEPSAIWGRVVRWGVIIASSTLLGIRLF